MTFGSTMALLLFMMLLMFLLFKKFSTSRQIISESLTPELSIQVVHTNILQGIKNVKEFSTKRIEFDSIIDISKSKMLFGKKIPFSEQKLILSYSAKLVCGCDLDKINIAHSFFNHNHLNITLPNSKIFDCYAIPGTVKIHNQKTQILADDVDLEFQDKAISEDLECHKQKYIEEGILLQSNENIRQILTEMVEPMGVVAEINFSDEKALPPPDSKKLLQ